MTYIKDVIQQVQDDAEKYGSAFADTALELFPDDELGLCDFVDRLFAYYYVTDSRQFIDFLVILNDVYDFPISPRITIYRESESLADAYIPEFLEAFFYAALAAVDDFD